MVYFMKGVTHPAMVETLNLFRNLYRWWKARRQPVRDVSEVFRFKYTCFRDLLDSNSQILAIISDLEEKLKGHQVFGMSYIRSQASRAAFHAFRMIKSLDVLSGHKYPMLYPLLDQIHEAIKKELGPSREEEAPAYTLPLAAVTREQVDWVGGKSANLGEVKNRVGLPVPPGFAVTTRAFHHFLGHGDLWDEINKRKMEIDPQDPESIEEVCRSIRELILTTPLPADLAGALGEAYRELAREVGGEPRVSLRSSALGEDSELSFAGQYLTCLNEPPERLAAAWREVVASLFTPRAVTYRLYQGIRDEDAAMAVCCLAMVAARASGVMYSRHPFDPLQDRVVIAGVWGLGPYAVDGTLSPDTFVVGKDPELPLLRQEIAVKPVALAAAPEGGLTEEAVPPERQGAPCLTEDQVRTLASWAIRLEEHYQGPQDIEWALDEQGRLFILQTRPLKVQARAGAAESPPLPGATVLLEGGQIACPGVGVGPVVRVETDEDLLHFPEGGVLVARQSSPRFVVVMARAQAVVTDHGSVAGHMAAVAREFGVPSLLDTRTATRDLPPGREVTVDALTGRVYLGRVPELLALRQERRPHMQDTPIYQVLRRVADHIVPLNLLDPRAETFAPASCRTLHDIARLVHEYSYREMFRISDLAAEQGTGALKLEAPLPLDLYLIDLGGALRRREAAGNRVTPEEVVSAPFAALLRGMLDPRLKALEPRPVELSGLLAVMREQWLSAPPTEDRFGDKSYAIISDKYMNFSSRVGYHFSVLDAYCGATLNKNYITFAFKGGAADEERRQRRIRAIARILTALHFTVEVTGDRLDARLAKYDCGVIQEKLEELGRLLIYTRQMDMLMASEASVELVAGNFLAGNYSLEPELLRPPAAAPAGPEA